MEAMTMDYKVEDPSVLKKVKPGDQITAKVFDGDFRTLHDVQVVGAKPAETKAGPATNNGKAPAKKK